VDAEIFVIGLGNIPSAGLEDGVASSPSYYFPLRTIEVDPQSGASNLDSLFNLLVRGSVVLSPERPQRYVIVLDVSGSQNMTFDGIGTEPGTGRDIQCANGPSGESTYGCTTPEYAYKDVAQRRIYVQKQAVESFIGLLNMPGNPSYDPTLPKDQVALVWYNQEARAESVVAPTSDPNSLRAAVLQAGRVGGDPYKTTGGTNWAAGLYRAYQALAAAPASTNELGGSYDYDERVIFVTDSVSSSFFEPAGATLDGGVSDVGTYPTGSPCRNLGKRVLEDGKCQTTDGGGQYQGVDRPITQAVQVSRGQIQSIPGRSVDVYVVALSNIPSTGLEAGVATTRSRFFPASNLEVKNGLTNVDRIFRLIASINKDPRCRPAAAAQWAETMAEANIPDVDILTPPQVGELILTSGVGDSYRAPILRDATTGRLSFQLADMPPGSYNLDAYIFYRGDDGVSRMYSLIYQAEQTQGLITVELAGGAQDLGAISLLLNGDVCAAPL
jgi:hypothetical protein